VRETRPNATFTSLLERYLELYPEKRRSPQEVEAARAVYEPGDAVVAENQIAPGPLQLPPPPPPPPPPPSPPPPRPAPAMLGWALNRAQLAAELSRPPPPMPFRAPLPPPFVPPRRGGYNDAALSGVVLDFAALSLSPALAGFFPSPGRARRRPPEEPQWNRRVPGQPNTVACVIATGARADITCDSCAKSLDTELHYECMTCRLYHLCSLCYKRGKRCPARHRMRPQKQVIDGVVPHLEVGLFCSVCDEWVDAPREPGNQLVNCFFWKCAGSCNDGDWHYCLRCVRRGNCCNHELRLYTNNRPAEPAQAIVRGVADTGEPGNHSLERRGYTHWWQNSARCNVCQRNVISVNVSTWFHCVECDDGQFDVCSNCVEHHRELLPEYGFCPRRHGMYLLTVSDVLSATSFSAGGNLRIVVRPELAPPEICRVDSPPHAAVAVAPNWSDDDEALQFPVGAEIRDVRVAFSAPNEQAGRDDIWYWGTYCGRGGMFEGNLVAFS